MSAGPAAVVTRTGGPAPGWGIAGTGKISHSVVSDLRLMDAEVVSVWSRDPDNAAGFAQAHGIPRSTASFDDLISSAEVDIVYLATPFATHFALARRALEAGKHVLVEKPMAMNASEVAGLFALARERGRFLMEAMWLKFNPVFIEARAVLADGRIGAPRSLRAGFGFPVPDDGGSRWDPARSPGALLDQGIYAVTVAHLVFGKPSAVSARGLVRSEGIDLTSHVTLSYPGGESAHFTTSMVEFADPSASISGTAGWIVIPAMFWVAAAIDIHAGSVDQMFRSPERVTRPRVGNGYAPMLKAVAAAVADGLLTHDVHGESDTVEVFEILDAVRAELARS